MADGVTSSPAETTKMYPKIWLTDQVKQLA